ncbi:MAG: tetratricopeptide repeat protein [Desulfuromonas sp.]|nr:tetratricopeptide repeat protein [Desulfuromonas sp.]
MLKHYALVLLVVLLIGGCSTNKPHIDMAQSHYKMAQSNMATKDYTSALHEMLQAVQLEPNNPDYQATLAMVYFEKQAYPQSEQHYKKALQLRPNDPIVENNLAALYMNMQRWDEAAALFRKVADNLLFRYKTRALIGMGVALSHGGKSMQAVLAYNEVLQDFPDNITALFLLGQTYYDMGKYALAQQRLSNIIKLRPEHSNARLLLGQCYMQLGQLDAAAGAFREVANREDGSELAAQAREYLQVVTSH